MKSVSKFPISVLVGAVAISSVFTLFIGYVLWGSSVAEVTSEVDSTISENETDIQSDISFEQDLSQVDETDLQNHAENLDIDTSLELSEEEVADLLFMREEEKLARDVYIALYDKWGIRIFSNISNSEQQHTNAIKSLIESYSLTDPVTDDSVGVFTNSDLQALYDQLVEQGSVSEEAALAVGALIEDLDIVDLENAMSRTENAAIIAVYANLQRGSRNHLRSFTSTLSRYGETYTPQYLSEEEYLAIIGGAMERGNGNGMDR